MKICDQRSIPYIALGSEDLDILDETDIIEVMEKYKPWAIINTAGYVKVDDAEINYNECYSVNAHCSGTTGKASFNSGFVL